MNHRILIRSSENNTRERESEMEGGKQRERGRERARFNIPLSLSHGCFDRGRKEEKT
jgi:hypothetical protein